MKLLPLPEKASAETGEGWTEAQMESYARANMEPLLRDRDALRNRLEDTVRDLTDAKAENARLRAQYQQAAESSEHFAARAERLAEALRWIASDETATASNVHSGMDEVDAIKGRARAALGQEGGK